MLHEVWALKTMGFFCAMELHISGLQRISDTQQLDAAPI